MTTSLYDTSRYYSKGSRLSSLLEPLLLFFDWMRARFVSQIADKGAVLDVGAGTGSFLYFMRRRGWTVYGTTLSEKSQEIAEKRFGITLEYTDAHPEALPQELSLVTYWHVFEHLEAPERHLSSLAKCVRHGGQVVVEVPNPEALGSRLNSAAWFGSDPVHHCNMKTRRELESLFREYGFELRSCSGFSLKFTIPYLWSACVGFLSWGRFTCAELVQVLQSPLRYATRNPFRTLLLFIWSIPALIGALILTPVGLVWGHPEVLILLFRKVDT